MKIALAGNPNCGKTSLFNELTGANQYVGNWPGVTVEKKSGFLRDHTEVEIQDLPGIYSLSPYTPEEVVSRKYLIEEKPDMIVNVVDATNLERNLYLTSQLLETGIPVVIALNMIDLVEQRGDSISIESLGQTLGCPVVEVSAVRHIGLDALRTLILSGAPDPAKPLEFPTSVEKALENIMQEQNCNRWQAVKLLENDEALTAALSTEQKWKIEAHRLKIEKEMDDDISSIVATCRYNTICGFVPQVLQRAATQKSISEKIDAVLTHRVLGLIIFIAVMWAIYYISIETIGTWGTDWANDVLFGGVVGGWLSGFIGNETAGIEAMTMVSAVLSMALIFPSALRRLHDTGRSGSWLYLAIAPFMLEYVCPHLPEGLHTVIMWCLYTANALILLACLLLPGTKGGNKYGDQTCAFTKNPMSLSGRGGRVEFLFWFILLSLVSWGIGLLGTLNLDCSEQLNSLINNGIVAGVGAVLGFLPQMAVLFLLLSLLEDCGYMARVAFMMDRLFRSIGLSGKSFIPLLVGMGCGVPGIMATRTIENEKDRRMSVMLTTFVPCGAKLPVIALFAALVGGGADVATIAYCAGFGSVILCGWILRKTHMFAGGYTPFVMELPPYHIPSGTNINMRAMERCRAFVKKAGTIIFLASAFVWFTSNYNWSMDYLRTDCKENENAVEQSMLADVGQALAPLFSPLGWGDWKPAVATVSGLIAKENIVGTLGVLYPAPQEQGDPAQAEVNIDAVSVKENQPQEEEGDELPRSSDLAKSNAFSILSMALWQSDSEVRAQKPADSQEEEEEEDEEVGGVAAGIKAANTFPSVVTAISFMLFNLLCAPCFAAIGAIRREMNSARWTWFAVIWMCGWAYIVSMLIYQWGTWSLTGTFGAGQIAACVISVVLLYLIARPTPTKAKK